MCVCVVTVANYMWIQDGETNDVVERFPVAIVQQPTSFNDQNDIYNNILIFTIQMPNESPGRQGAEGGGEDKCFPWNVCQVFHIDSFPFALFAGELHIFQCVSHEAVNVVDDIYQWMRHYGVVSNGSNGTKGGPVTGSAGSSSASGSSSTTTGDKSLTSPSNINVKEAVTVFNQIAAQREK